MVRRSVCDLKVKNAVPWTYLISDHNVEEIIGKFYEKKLQKPNRKNFRLEKVKKKQSNELYAKWKK